MHVVWGLITATVGLFLAICGFFKSNLAVYQLLVARSRLLWGDAVHGFYQVVGLTLVALGLLWAFGIIWK